MLFIANLKQYLTTKQTLDYVSSHLEGLKHLAQRNSIVICPSFPALHPVNALAKHTKLLTGAQHVSAKQEGAFTGEVGAQDLHELGCSFCIVGHSERRTLFHQSDEEIIAACMQLINNNVTPIICIGETLPQREQGLTEQVLTRQLEPLLTALKKEQLPPAEVVIAYEPQWAIGTDRLPTRLELAAVFQFLAQLTSHYRDSATCTLLYGGSVSSSSMQNLTGIANLGGFLIGRASLDFQELKKIVDYSV